MYVYYYYYSHTAMATDNVSKLGYISDIRQCGSQGRWNGTYYCDLLLLQQLLSAIRHVSSEFIF